jgi:hypothetical protein
VASRLFEFEMGETEEMALLPLIDMCNHQVPNKTDWKYNSERKGFEIVATDKIAEGEQIFIHYRKAIDVSDFFITYGYYDRSV